MQVIPPYWAQDAPVDTCGAGDAYAAGVLWAYLRGMGVSAMGRAGARVASQVSVSVWIYSKCSQALSCVGCLSRLPQLQAGICNGRRCVGCYTGGRTVQACS